MKYFSSKFKPAVIYLHCESIGADKVHIPEIGTNAKNNAYFLLCYISKADVVNNAFLLHFHSHTLFAFGGIWGRALQ